jgi:hypothetical protein
MPNANENIYISCDTHLVLSLWSRLRHSRSNNLAMGQPEAVFPEMIRTAAIASTAIILAGAALANTYASCFEKTPQNTSKLTGEQ